MRPFVCCLFLALISARGSAQQPSPSGHEPAASQAPPRSDSDKDDGADADARQSSSRDTRIDVSPPKDDVKNHPGSGAAVSQSPVDDAPAPDAVQEMKPWNPYRAAKDDEVGDFYFKRKSYRAALARYQDALAWKDNDAIANFRMAQCYEKLDQPTEAIAHYQEYLKILPQGPLSKDAHKALQRLHASETPETGQSTPPRN